MESLDRVREAIDWLDQHRPSDGAGSAHDFKHVQALSGLASALGELEERLAAVEQRPGPDPRSAFIGG